MERVYAVGQARACLSLAERQLADVRGAAQYDGKDDDVANLEMALKETRDALASLEVGKRGEAARVDCAMPYFHRLAARARHGAVQGVLLRAARVAGALRPGSVRQPSPMQVVSQLYGACQLRLIAQGVGNAG